MGLWVFVIRNIRSNQLLDYSFETVLTGWKTLVVLGNCDELSLCPPHPGINVLATAGLDEQE